MVRRLMEEKGGRAGRKRIQHDYNENAEQKLSRVLGSEVTIPADTCMLTALNTDPKRRGQFQPFDVPLCPPVLLTLLLDSGQNAGI